MTSNKVPWGLGCLWWLLCLQWSVFSSMRCGEQGWWFPSKMCVCRGWGCWFLAEKCVFSCNATLDGSNAERIVENGRWEWAPRSKNGYFSPSNSLWQQIFIIFTLILCGGVVENDRRGWGPLRFPPGGSKYPEMTKINPWACNSEAILGPLGPPGGTPRGPPLVYHFLLLPRIRLV